MAMKRLSGLFVLIGVACVHAIPETTQSMCSKPPVLGNCPPLRNVWHYHYQINACVKYKDSDCGVGYNQFMSKEKCDEACLRPPGQKQELCLRNTITGSCQPKMRAWYHDPEDGFCKMFNHGECGRGANHFATEQKCLETCKPPDQRKVVCSLPQSPGVCYFVLYRFFFDHKRNNCFLIRGRSCGKNDNAFVSHGDCMRRCSHPKTPRPCYNCGTKNKGQQTKAPGAVKG
nr:amblin [Dermacentor andersoni]